MKMIPLAILAIAITTAFACNQPSGTTTVSDTTHTTRNQAADSGNTSGTSSDDKAFLETLYGKMNEKPVTEDGKPYRLIKKEQVKLYGGQGMYTLAYVDFISGPPEMWPYKTLYIIDPRGSIAGNYITEQYDLVSVFDHADPLLMITSQNTSGQGIHLLIGIENPKNKRATRNYLDSKNWDVLTIDKNKYTPAVLPYEVKDQNGDGQKEIIFSGKKDSKPFSITYVWNEEKETFEPESSK